MKKFLMPKSRILLSLVLCLCALILLVSIVLLNLEASPIWCRYLANIFQAIAIVCLLALGIYFQTFLPGASDFLEAAKLKVYEDKRIKEAWADIQLKRLLFSEMSKKLKFFHILVIGVGMMFGLFGIADLFGVFPEMPGPGGKALSHWLTGLLFITAGGIFFFVYPLIWRLKAVSRHEEAVQKLIKDVEEGKIKPPASA